MTFTLKVKNGKVNFITKAGEDMVQNNMSEEIARRIINEKKAVVDNTFEGYPIKAGDYFFEGTVENKKAKEETPNEN